MADNFLLAPTAAAPASGQWKRGPADTHTQFADGDSDSIPGDVAVTTDYDSNELRFSLGVYDDPANSAGIVDLLFTVTATGDPFADGLFLTNEAVVSMSNTYVQSAETPAVVQIEMGSPNLNITKGIVATDSGNAVFSSATVGTGRFHGARIGGHALDGNRQLPGARRNADRQRRLGARRGGYCHVCDRRRERGQWPTRGL
jgi:hypothetical protein